MADGGEGTVEALQKSLGGKRLRMRLAGPLGRPVTARWLWVPARRLAAVEAAEILGFARVPAGRRDPMRAATRGLGQWMLRAARRRPRAIWIGLGGTSTVDGGIGALEAAGVRFLDAKGNPVGEGGGALLAIRRIDRRGLDRNLQKIPIRLLCDVRSPLLGPTGAARMFGPQKGAGPAQVEVLERGLAALARAIRRDGKNGRDVARLPGAGAAGGIAAGFWGLIPRACVVPGARAVAKALRLENAIRRADLVVTGEGRLDAQTLQGKGVAEVCRLARRAGRPVIAVVGENCLSPAQTRRLGVGRIFEGPRGAARAAAAIGFGGFF